MSGLEESVRAPSGSCGLVLAPVSTGRGGRIQRHTSGKMKPNTFLFSLRHLVFSGSIGLLNTISLGARVRFKYDSSFLIEPYRLRPRGPQTLDFTPKGLIALTGRRAVFV